MVPVERCGAGTHSAGAERCLVCGACCGGFAGSHNARRRPSPKNRPGDSDALHSQFAQFGGIEAEVFQVGESDLTAGLEDADDFADCFATTLAAGNVVNGEVRDNGVKSGAGKRQFAHVAVANFNAVCDAFQCGVLQSCFP